MKKVKYDKLVKKYEKELDYVLAKMLPKYFNSFELYENNYLISEICEQMIIEINDNPKLNYKQAAKKSIKKIFNRLKK